LRLLGGFNVILKILASLLLIAMTGMLVTCLDISFSHSPDIEMNLYINGEIQGNATSEYHESTWLGYENETIFTWKGGMISDKKNNTTTNSTTHKLNRMSPASAQGI
jgi:hypothetical protein